jgi:putative FmdB family regulatory protein
MPTYSYRCSACSHTFDKVQRITEDAIKVCPACGAEAASRLITSGNFMLKGGGWYGDLYSGSSNKKGVSTAGESTSTVKASGGGEAVASAVPAPAASAPAAPSTPSTPSSSSN